MPRKNRSEGTRAPNGASTVYLGKDGYWHGRVSVGVKDNGKPDRRHVQRSTEGEVVRAVQKLERERSTGKVRKAGQRWTVAAWLEHWLTNITAPPAITENAYDAYRNAVYVHLIPGLGAHYLHKLEPEHLERLYRTIVKNGGSPGNAHQVHRTVRTALNVAVRRKHITENPANEARAPKVNEVEVEPYKVDEIKRLFDTAATDRNSARWVIALALGLRQGEVLGLRWSDIDLEQGTLIVRRNRLRPKWSHGCGGGCGHKQAGRCPKRRPARPETAQTKSRAGLRGIGIPDPVIDLLKTHQREQDTERARAADLWIETDYVFTTELGELIHPRTDYSHWRQLLTRAKVPDRRLHDARHTAATVLLILGVPERTVMSVMGWSNTAMAARYQHVIAAIRRDVATQLGGLLWAHPSTNDQGNPDENGGK